MIFEPTPLPGAWLIKPERISDERGHFARTFCEQEFSAANIPFIIRQTSTSFNPAALTLRGMHYQASEAAETKLVRCVRGKIFDVALDLRPASPTYRQWHGVELSVDNGVAFLIPPGCAHGFLTLTPESEVGYMMDAFYQKDAAKGVRWDDPAFAIKWPAVPSIISQQDATWPFVKA